jgi:hypothetical protein
MSVAPCTCPAELFAHLWGELVKCDSTARLRASPSAQFGINPDPFDAFNVALRGAFLNRDGATVAQQLQELIKQFDKGGESLLPLQIRVMLALNKQFRAIHPRHAVLPVPGHNARASVPRWLRELSRRRQDSGAYATYGGYYVVPRGPLTRRARSVTASSASDPYDMFDALSAVRRQLHENERPIQINFRVIRKNGGQGVTANPWPGHERILFAPVAEEASSLILTDIERDGHAFVSIECAKGFNPSKRLLGALKVARSVDIAIAPEFVMPEREADVFAQSMPQLKTKPPRVTVIGSGHTNSTTNSQVWNESRGVNSIGAELWRQRKIWPAGLSADRATRLGLRNPGKELVTEDTGCGDKLLVIDIEEFGRCITLICQDLHLHPLAEEILKCYQPDWVFVPILDKDIETGRWAHQRAFALSELSHARFLVANSSSLGQKLGVDKTHTCGLAIGPKAATSDPDSIDIDDEDDKARQVGILKVTLDNTPGAMPAHDIIEWRDSDFRWQQTTLGT